MLKYEYVSGWSEIDDILRDIPRGKDIAEFMREIGWKEWDRSGDESAESIAIFKNNNAVYLIEFNTFDSWEWVLCPNFQSMMELYSKWASIVTAKGITALFSEIEPMMTVARQSEEYQGFKRREKEYYERMKAKRDRG